MLAVLCLISSLQKPKEAMVVPAPVVNEQAKAWRDEVGGFVYDDVKR